MTVGVSEPSSPAFDLHKIRLRCLRGHKKEDDWDAYARVAVKCDDEEEFELFSSRDPDCQCVPRQLDGGGSWETETNAPSRRGVRIAGDTRIMVIEAKPSGLFGKKKKVIDFWVHTSFLEQPPAEMCGNVHTLSEAECTKQKVPPGTILLALKKHELDGVAKDTKHKKVTENFGVELLLTPLGLNGIGSKTRLNMNAEQRPKTVPYQEKQDYSRYCEERWGAHPRRPELCCARRRACDSRPRRQVHARAPCAALRRVAAEGPPPPPPSY